MNRIHTANYFKKMLEYYQQISNENKKYWHGFTDGMVEIHRAGEKFVYYTIYSNGKVTKHFLSDEESSSGREIPMSELTGDNFELFSTVQITRTGYLMIESNITAMEAITYLCSYINENEQEHKVIGRRETWECPLLCGSISFKDNLVSRFQYYATTKSELELQTISELKEKIEAPRCRVISGAYPTVPKLRGFLQ